MDKKQLIQQIESSRGTTVITYPQLFNFNLEKDNILYGFATMGYNFLIDANTSHRSFTNFEDHVWAVKGVKSENSGWADYIDSSHTLDTFTRDSFNETGDVILTSPIDDLVSTVTYSVVESTVTCGQHNRTLINTVLTGYSGITVYACSNLSATDFSSLVWAVAFPNLILFTNEKCLGWCSAPLLSFSIEKRGAILQHTPY